MRPVDQCYSLAAQKRAVDVLLVGVGGAVMAVAVLVLPLGAVLAALASIAVAIALVANPSAAIVAAVAGRGIVDLTSAIELGPMNAMEAYAGMATLAALFLIVVHMREVARSELFIAAGFFSVVVAIGLLRDPTAANVTSSVKSIGPWTTLLLIPALLTKRSVRPLLIAIALASLPAVLSSAYFGLTGQRSVYANQASRLLGLYVNLTHHSLMMFVFCAVGGWLALTSRGWRRALFVVQSSAALFSLFLTYTRAAWVGFAATVLLYLSLSGRYRLLVAAVVAGGIALSSSDVMLSRLSDISIAADGSEFQDESDEAGSGRGKLWRSAVREYASEDVLDQLLGRGARGTSVAAVGRDPHSDPLFILFQFGPIGVLAWSWVLFRTVGRAMTHPDRASPDADMRRFLIALSGGCMLNSVLTNGFISRAGPAWVFGALLGALLLMSRRGPTIRQALPTRSSSESPASPSLV